MSQLEQMPSIDLSDPAIMARQYKNIEVFQRLRAILLASLCLGFLTIIFGDEVVAKENEYMLVNFVFFVLLIAFFCSLRYKCPNCKTAPIAVSVSATNEITYSKGLNLLPSRCQCCGFYLSQYRLKKDLMPLMRK